MQIKIRIQGTEQEVTFMRNVLLRAHMNLILSKPREGTNPKYEDFNGLFSYSGPGDNGTVNQHHFVGNFGQPDTTEADGIILFRIRFKADATSSRHHITKLELEA